MKRIVLLVCVSGMIAIGCRQNQEGGVERAKEAKQFDFSKYSGNINQDGRMIVEEVSQVFLQALTEAIDKHGVAGAVEYCNGAAFPILDSLAEYYGLGLKRTALRYRSVVNEPDTLDKLILGNMENLSSQGAEPSPMSMKFGGGDGVYYSPIIMKPLCLQCHGIKSRGDISDEVWAKIRELYPEDRAFDYNLNELRGVWGVYFPAEYWARRGKPDPLEIN
jgi:hypothetical protein